MLQEVCDVLEARPQVTGQQREALRLGLMRELGKTSARQKHGRGRPDSQTQREKRFPDREIRRDKEQTHINKETGREMERGKR